MKKLLVVLLALTLFGVFAMAQDAPMAPALAFSGNLETGVKILSDANGIFSASYNDNTSNSFPQELYLDGVWSGTSIGGKFEIDTSVAGPSAFYNVAKIDALFAWWKPISMLTLNVGEGFGAVYATPIEGWGTDMAGGGLGLVLAPIDGFKLGASYFIPSDAQPTYASKDYVIEASYAATGIATLGAAYDMGSYEFLAGLNVTAVAGLTAQVDFRYYTSDAATAKVGYQAEENFAYAIGALTPAVWAGESNQPGAEKWQVKPNVAYAMGMATPGAYFIYKESGNWGLGAWVGIAVEKQSFNFYVDYNKDKSYDIGVNTKISF